MSNECTDCRINLLNIINLMKTLISIEKDDRTKFQPFELLSNEINILIFGKLGQKLKLNAVIMWFCKYRAPKLFKILDAFFIIQ